MKKRGKEATKGRRMKNEGGKGRGTRNEEERKGSDQGKER